MFDEQTKGEYIMEIRIKNWSKHQHFKDRTPPWIKLYRDILDDPDWHDLDGDTSKVLVMLWLIASEDETHAGMLPDMRKLAFRLRMAEKELKQHINKLSQWLIFEDISPVSECYHVDAPETETEGDKEKEVEREKEDNFLPMPSAPAPRKTANPEVETELQAACRATWASYSIAYSSRYRTDPVRNAKVNAQIKQFCQALHHSEAPDVAAFYVTHNDTFYVRKGHDPGLMLTDASKLRTEWITGNRMTAAKAKQIDGTSAMLDAAERIKRDMGAV